MRILVACEFSGRVRDAFIAKGNDAISCDLLPSEKPGPHIQCDLKEAVINCGPFDLLIAHPPCTYLANSGVRWLYGGKGSVRDEKRWQLMREAAALFNWLLTVDVPRVVIENPIMHRHAGIRRPDQIIHPWMFGHGETKATCLWLKGLPPLVPTLIVNGREQVCWKQPPGPDRWKNRSRTYPGIASAMAEQYSFSCDNNAI